MHEGDVYFERCYGAEFDPRVSHDQREACWEAWLAYYTKAQPAHRVDYALRRTEALQNGESSPALPGLAPERAAQGGVDAGPSSAHGFSESAYDRVLDGDAGAIPNGCGPACEAHERRCGARCPSESHDCQLGCQQERALCMNGCY